MQFTRSNLNNFKKSDSNVDAVIEIMCQYNLTMLDAINVVKEDAETIERLLLEYENDTTNDYYYVPKINKMPKTTNEALLYLNTFTTKELHRNLCAGDLKKLHHAFYNASTTGLNLNRGDILNLIDRGISSFKMGCSIKFCHERKGEL